MYRIFEDFWRIVKLMSMECEKKSSSQFLKNCFKLDIDIYQLWIKSADVKGVQKSLLPNSYNCIELDIDIDQLWIPSTDV